MSGGALAFAVWRETHQLPRHAIAAFRDGQDALNWAEQRAKRDDERRDITVWRVIDDQPETCLATFKPQPAEAA